MKTSESENNFQCVNDDHIENTISKERFSTWHAKSVSCEQTIVFFFVILLETLNKQSKLFNRTKLEYRLWICVQV